MGHDVFISYSKLDKPTADALCATMESHGIRCWIAPRDVVPGADWGEAIVKAIGGCRVMVLIFSSHANSSRQVRREVQRAFERELTVIPFRVENVAPVEALEYYIGPVHWLDALTPPLEKHLQSLAAQVQRLLGPGVEDTGSDPHPGPSSLSGPSPSDPAERVVRPKPSTTRVDRDSPISGDKPSRPTARTIQGVKSEGGSMAVGVPGAERDGIEAVRRFVARPAGALVVYGGLRVAFHAYFCTVWLLKYYYDEKFIGQGEKFFIICIILHFLLLMISGVAAWGGIQMRRLKNYRLAALGSILLSASLLVEIIYSYLFMNFSFVDDFISSWYFYLFLFISIPIGIWSLVILRRPEVRSSFSR
jgi:hypothetical protein